MHNVFVSYCHRLDQDAADDFRRNFSIDKECFSDKSLSGDIGYLADETIKNLYKRPRIKESSVTIVLIGKETSRRWWIDWEIYYSLRRGDNNERNGLLGIYLPNKEHNAPLRLLQNTTDEHKMGKIIYMPDTKRELEMAIEEVYNCRFRGVPDLGMDLRQRNS